VTYRTKVRTKTPKAINAPLAWTTKPVDKAILCKQGRERTALGSFEGISITKTPEFTRNYRSLTGSDAMSVPLKRHIE